MLILGADPEQLETLARRIRNHADYYEGIRHDIVRSLRGMGWDGPDADQFRNKYDTRIAPQISEAASFLRSAESDLVRNAVAQRNASSILLVAAPCRVAEESNIWGGTRTLGSPLGSQVFPFGALGFPFGPHAAPIQNTLLLYKGYEWVRETLGPYSHIVDLSPALAGQAILSHKLFGGTRVASPVAKALAGSRAVGYVSRASTVLLPLAAAYGIANLETDKRQLSDALASGDMEEVLFSSTDLGLTGTAIIGAAALGVGLLLPILAPAAAVVVAAAGFITLGLYAAKGIGVLWQHRDEIGKGLSDALQATYEFGEDFVEGVADIVDAGAEFVGDVVDAGAEFVGDVVDAGAEFVGDTVDAGADLVSNVASKVSGWLSWN